MKKEKQETMAAYEAPKVEVIEVQIEKGFAASDTPDFVDGGEL